MLRAFWFLFKLSVLVAGFVWLIERPGTIEMQWLGYEIKTTVGFAAAMLLGVLFIWTLVYRLWSSLVSVPFVYRRWRAAQLREKGYRALTSGFISIAAGDGRSAEKHAKTALGLVPETPLVRLLSAQTALMNGNAPKARREFTTLLEDGEAAFFGLRGLLNEHLHDKNYAEALLLAERAEKLQPNRLWVLRTLFDLQTKNCEWKKALLTLRKAEKAGVFTSEAALRHRTALLLALSEKLEKQDKVSDARNLAKDAFALMPGFPPAAMHLAQLYRAAEKRRAALKTIEKAWEKNPHPDLAILWQDMAPPAKKSVSIYDSGRHVYVWVKKLTDIHPDHHDSHYALGHAALEAGLWREARDNLASARDYRAMARLEQAETRNETKAREWLEQAAEEPAERKWTCTSCSHSGLQWEALCPQCRGFNTAEWIVPEFGRSQALLDNGGFVLPPADLITPPVVL